MNSKCRFRNLNCRRALYDAFQSRNRVDAIIRMLEEGRLLKHILLFILIAAAVYSLSHYSSHSETFSAQAMNSNIIYRVKKASSVPDKKKANHDVTTTKVSENEGLLNVEDLKRTYFAYVISKIEKNKVYPAEEIRRGNVGVVALSVPIHRDGTAGKVSVLRNARYPRLTEAAIMTVEKSFPFPPYPSGINEDTLILQLNMDFRIDGN